MNRAFGDFLISAAALVGLFVLLATFDDRVREQISMRIGAGSPTEQVGEAGAVVGSLVGVVFDAVRDQSIEQAPLVIFVMAAVVLVLVMLRT